MSNYGEFMKSMAKKDNDFFFGENNKVNISNKYFTFKHVIDNDTIIINTNNVKTVKDNYVLVVDNNKAVYLRDWQVREAHNYNEGLDFYLVKLNRKYFKPYTFKFEFSDFCFENGENSFDDLLEVAKEQDKENMKVANGFFVG